MQWQYSYARYDKSTGIGKWHIRHYNAKLCTSMQRKGLLKLQVYCAGAARTSAVMGFHACERATEEACLPNFMSGHMIYWTICRPIQSLIVDRALIVSRWWKWYIIYPVLQCQASMSDTSQFAKTHCSPKFQADREGAWQQPLRSNESRCVCSFRRLSDK